MSLNGGVDNDEQAAGVAGIRSVTDGATATKSMIAQYKSSGTFSADYPAFHYIYNTMNGGNENGVWYLPARDELKMLYAGYSGKVYEEITDWISTKCRIMIRKTAKWLVPHSIPVLQQKAEWLLAVAVILPFGIYLHQK